MSEGRSHIELNNVSLFSSEGIFQKLKHMHNTDEERGEMKRT